MKKAVSFVVCIMMMFSLSAAGFAAETVESEGWTGISMANDWASIYGEGVSKTGLPGAEQELEEAA